MQSRICTRGVHICMRIFLLKHNVIYTKYTHIPENTIKLGSPEESMHPLSNRNIMKHSASSNGYGKK